MKEAGKGDARRPMAVSDQQYAQRWDLIFGRDNHEEAIGEDNGEAEQRVGLEREAKLHGK